MHRYVSLLAVCLLAMAAGAVGTAAGARSEPADKTHEEEIAAKARHMGVGATVKVTLADGKRATGTIVALGNADLRLFASQGDLAGEQTIRYADIASIKQKGSRTALWIGIGVVVGILVPMGICAASA